MHLERAYGRDDDDRVRLEAGEAALDVEEFLRSEVGGEAGFGDEVVGELESVLGRHDAVAAVRDVREGAAVDEGRDVLKGLDEVRLYRVLEEHRHRALRFEVARGDGLVFVGVGDDDVREALLEVFDALREAEYRHDLGGDCDVEAVLARHAVDLAAEADDYVAERAVVHVEDALEDYAARVDVERVALLYGVVEHRGEKVVRRGDGVEVAGEVDVDVFHRDDLAVSAAGGSALDSEDGAERGLAQRERDLFAELRKGLREADGGRRLAFAGGRRRYRGDEDEFAVLVVFHLFPEVEGDLRLVFPVELEVVGVYVETLGDFGDRFHLSLLRYFDIA